MRLTGFMQDDLKRINPRDYEREIARWVGHNFADVFAFGGPSWTLWDDSGVPIACGGVVIMWGGVGEAWMSLSPAFYHNVKRVYAIVARKLDEIQEAMGLWRIQAPISAERPENQNFVEHLGFEAEGIMRLWGPECCNYVMYARIAKEYKR